jgi:hypothetical protein
MGTAVDRLIRMASDEVLSILPAEPEYSSRVIQQVSERIGHRPGQSGIPKSIVVLVVVAAMLAGAAFDGMAHKATQGLESLVREPTTNLRARVLIWQDGRSELFLLEDRQGDPRQVLRVISVQSVSPERIQEIFGQPVPVPRSLALNCEGPSISSDDLDVACSGPVRLKAH